MSTAKRTRWHLEGGMNPGHVGCMNRVSALSRRWNTILPSLLATFEKLQKLGFTYCDGKVTVIIPDLVGKKEDHE